MPTTSRRVLIYGAGEAGAMVVEEITKHPEEQIAVFGFIDDDPQKRGTRVRGVKVFGARQTLVGCIRNFDINEMIIAMPSIGKPVIRDIVKVCMAEKVKLLIVPSTREILEGTVRFDQIKSLDLADLLDREEVRIDDARIRSSIEGKRVLVTGAAGSIGSVLVHKILTYEPSVVIALDINENGLFYLSHTVGNGLCGPRTRFIPCVADIKDRAILGEIFSLYEPELIYHAAAYKHVPLMESHQRMVLLNNILGTRNLLDLSGGKTVEKFIGISTDKAVHPISIMGKTKRICELMIRAYAERGVNGCTVRFGNVLGSNGSVITVFQEQIRQGGPLTITSPCMERFFMTIHEATSLVLQAGSFGRDGNIYVLDMGRPIRIKELAENLIVLSGLTPGSDIAINYIGLREGEKLSETLFWEDAQIYESEHSGIFIEKSAVDGAALLDNVQRLSDSIYQLNADQLSGAVDDTLALRGNGPAGRGRALSGVAVSAAD